MRMEVHVHGNIPLCKGVSRNQIETALNPWLDYLDVDSIDEAKSLEPEEPGIALDDKDRVLSMCWTGDIGRSFHRRLEESLQQLGPYAEEAAEVEVSVYHDNGEEEYRIIFVGPTPESIRQAERNRMVDDIAALLSRRFDQQAVDEVLNVVHGLFERDWAGGGGSSSGSESTSGSQPHVRPHRKHLH
ncbi:MAG TPA: DUF6806 family protein [Burkholderiales bacterium]|nr:DUF6806 family protein [Burkholderiales bacterium]